MSLIEKAANKRQEAQSSLVERAAERLKGHSAAGKKKARTDDKRQDSEPRTRLKQTTKTVETPAKPEAEAPEARSTTPVGVPESRPSETPEKATGAATAAATPSPDQPRRRRSRFHEVNLKGLEERGFITPDVGSTPTVEEFRLIKRSLLLNAFATGEGAIQNGNLILVTSSRPGEGKTFCAINLAFSIALEQDVTVLLVDADFGKPEVLSTLGIAGGRGLVDAIAEDDVDLADCIIRTNIPNLSVLPAGRQHNRTPELLASGRMGEMMDEIAKRYNDRVVIFDSPPALASSAASVMALHVGQSLFVIEAEMTTEDQAREAISLISPCDHISMILNKARFVGADTQFGSYYGYSTR